MIVAGKRADWFIVTGDDAITVQALPGVKWVAQDKFEVHRSLLAMLPDGHKFLVAHQQSSTIWEARDQHTAQLGFKLRTTQQQALDFISGRRGTLLGDDPRLGKTASAVMAHDPSSGPLWVIAPLSTRAVWLGWMRKIFPNTDIGIIAGRKYNARLLDAPMVWGHYDIIHGWQTSHKIGTLVFDEAHMLTNPDARRTNAAVYLQRQAKRVLALTGTPIWNMPPDLWSVIGLVAPGAWGSYHEFARRYGAPESTGYGMKYTGVSNEAELRLRLQEVMLRRRWVDVCDDLPAISRSVIVAEVDQTLGRKLDILAAAIKTQRTNTIGNLASYRRAVATTKISTVAREAEKILDRDEPVVIWAWHKDVAERLAEKLGARAVMIHGDVNPKERELRIDRWKATQASALIATMPVAQVGIDLSHARVAIFAEIDYTPAVLAQAEMRTFLATRPMDIIFVIANHLVDQRIVRALINKLSAADPVGVGAACAAIDALREAVMGPEDSGDLDRMLEDLIASMT